MTEDLERRGGRRNVGAVHSRPACINVIGNGLRCDQPLMKERATVLHQDQMVHKCAIIRQ